MTYLEKYTRLKTLLLADENAHLVTTQLDSNILTLDVRIKNHAISLQEGYCQLLRLCSENIVTAELAKFLFTSCYDTEPEENVLVSKTLLMYLFKTKSESALSVKIDEIKRVYSPILVKDYIYVTMSEHLCGHRINFLEYLKDIKEFYTGIDAKVAEAYVEEAVTLYKASSHEHCNSLRKTIENMTTLIHKVAELKRDIDTTQPAEIILQHGKEIEQLGNQLKTRIQQFHTPEPVSNTCSRFIGITLLIVGTVIATAGVLSMVVVPFSLFGMSLINLGLAMNSSMSAAGALMTAIGLTSIFTGLYQVSKTRQRDNPLTTTVDALLKSSARITQPYDQIGELFKPPKPAKKQTSPVYSPFLNMHRP